MSSNIEMVEILGKEIIKEIGKGDSVLSVDIQANKIIIHLNRMQDFASIQNFAEYETLATDDFVHHKKKLGIVEYLALEKIKGAVI